jgi:hypothetical protein
VYELDVMPSGGVGRLMVRLRGHPGIKVVEMWRYGMFVETLDGSQVGSVVLERDNSIRLRVQCFVLKESTQEHLIQLVTDECLAMLNAMYARLDVKPFHEFVSCPHCLRKTGKPDVVRMPKEQCAQLVAANEQSFECGAERVSVSELRVDVAFGDLTMFNDSALVIEPEPFAAGSFGVVSRALLGEAAVVVKELNPSKAKQWLSKKEGRVPPHQEPNAAEPNESFNAEAFAEFQHEAALMSKLPHANIVALHGIMLAPLRLVMEYCQHGDLLSVLEKQALWKGPVNIDDAGAAIPPVCWKIISDIAQGMAFLHAQQPPIAHRDLRSPNVFLVSLDPNAACCAKVSNVCLLIFALCLLSECAVCFLVHRTET